jgi:hypothetical protein
LEPFLLSAIFYISSLKQRGGLHMRKIVLLIGIFLFFPSITWAQEKIEAPVWNVGDKWVFTKGNIEVVGADKNSYTLNFSKDTCILENNGFEKIIFDKSTLNRIYALKDDKREKYTVTMRRILNFPFNLGEEWKDTCTARVLVGLWAEALNDYSEAFKVLGWENVGVKAGNFKTIKLEYTLKNMSAGPVIASPFKHIYWYAPEIKYFVKCQYDQGLVRGSDWELTSFRAAGTSDFHKLSLPAKWKGEWFAWEYTGPLPVTLEITRADEKTVHVIYSWKATPGWNVQSPGRKEGDAKIFTDNGRPAFMWKGVTGNPLIFYLEKDGTLFGETQSKTSSLRMARTQ